MAWEVEVTDQFLERCRKLDTDDIGAMERGAALLESIGTVLGRPHVDTISGSRHSNNKELRVQSKGRPIRVFFAFDPRRIAILLIAGDKSGDDLFYDRMIPIADDLYDQHS